MNKCQSPCVIKIIKRKLCFVMIAILKKPFMLHLLDDVFPMPQVGTRFH